MLASFCDKAAEMRLGFLLLFIAVPLVELALLIRLGGWLGLWPTLGIIVLTALLGTWMLRQQGLSTFSRAMASLSEGEPPVGPMIEGALLLIAGAFLLTPGIITDAVGGLLLIPPFRQWVAQQSLKTAMARGNIHVQTSGMRTSSGRGPGGASPGETKPDGPAGPMGGNRGGGPVIDGEYERVDEKTIDPRRAPSDQ